MIRALAVAAAVGALTVGAMELDSQSAEAALARCVLEIMPHEDNSYSKGAAYVDGVKVSHLWTVGGPAVQGKVIINSKGLRAAYVDWPASFQGNACTFRVVGSTALPTSW